VNWATAKWILIGLGTLLYVFWMLSAEGTRFSIGLLIGMAALFAAVLLRDEKRLKSRICKLCGSKFDPILICAHVDCPHRALIAKREVVGD